MFANHQFHRAGWFWVSSVSHSWPHSGCTVILDYSMIWTPWWLAVISFPRFILSISRSVLLCIFLVWMNWFFVWVCSRFCCLLLLLLFSFSLYNTMMFEKKVNNSKQNAKNRSKNKILSKCYIVVCVCVRLAAVLSLVVCLFCRRIVFICYFALWCCCRARVCTFVSRFCDVVIDSVRDTVIPSNWEYTVNNLH